MPANDIFISHPGEVLYNEFMRPLKLTANELALALRVPPSRITTIINSERAVSADTALRRARYFDTTADYWLHMQVAYDLAKARVEIGRQITAEIPVSSRLLFPH